MGLEFSFELTYHYSQCMLVEVQLKVKNLSYFTLIIFLRCNPDSVYKKEIKGSLKSEISCETVFFHSSEVQSWSKLKA